MELFGWIMLALFAGAGLFWAGLLCIFVSYFSSNRMTKEHIVIICVFVAVCAINYLVWSARPFTIIMSGG